MADVNDDNGSEGEADNGVGGHFTSLDELMEQLMRNVPRERVQAALNVLAEARERIGIGARSISLEAHHAVVQAIQQGYERQLAQMHGELQRARAAIAALAGSVPSPPTADPVQTRAAAIPWPGGIATERLSTEYEADDAGPGGIFNGGS